MRVDNITDKAGTGPVTIGAGASIVGVTTFASGITTADSNGLRVAGIVTATSFYGSGANLTNLNIPATFDWRDSSLF